FASHPIDASDGRREVRDAGSCFRQEKPLDIPVGGVPGFTDRIGELAGLAWPGEVRVGEHRPCVRRASDALQPGTLNEMCVTRIGFARLHFEALLLVGNDACYDA